VPGFSPVVTPVTKTPERFKAVPANFEKWGPLGAQQTKALLTLD